MSLLIKNIYICIDEKYKTMKDRVKEREYKCRLERPKALYIRTTKEVSNKVNDMCNATGMNKTALIESLIKGSYPKVMKSAAKVEECANISK